MIQTADRGDPPETLGAMPGLCAAPFRRPAARAGPGRGLFAYLGDRPKTACSLNTRAASSPDQMKFPPRGWGVATRGGFREKPPVSPVRARPQNTAAFFEPRAGEIYPAMRRINPEVLPDVHGRRFCMGGRCGPPGRRAVGISGGVGDANHPVSSRARRRKIPYEFLAGVGGLKSAGPRPPETHGSSRLHEWPKLENGCGPPGTGRVLSPCVSRSFTGNQSRTIVF